MTILPFADDAMMQCNDGMLMKFTDMQISLLLNIVTQGNTLSKSKQVTSCNRVGLLKLPVKSQTVRY